jgi:hypothetical protein
VSVHSTGSYKFSPQSPQPRTAPDTTIALHRGQTPALAGHDHPRGRPALRGPEESPLEAENDVDLQQARAGSRRKLGKMQRG